jgi:hypothetical protein
MVGNASRGRLAAHVADDRVDPSGQEIWLGTVASAPGLVFLRVILIDRLLEVGRKPIGCDDAHNYIGADYRLYIHPEFALR